MKTILVATDFSNSAANAVEYAAEMAAVMGAKLILFHAYHVPVLGTEIPVEIQTLEEMEKRGLGQVNGIADEIRARFNNRVELECICKCGFAVDEINRYARKKKAELVVMGMQGGGFISEKLFGSVTTSVLEKSDCPVLVVHDKARFHTIKRIVLACDIDNDRLHLPVPLKKIARFFKAHVFVLDVVPGSVLMPSQPGEITDLGSFIREFSEIEHSFHFWRGENPVEGINDFVAEKMIDLVVMMPRRRSFLSKVFHPSNTNHMAFHSTVPLLVLRDTENNTN